MVTQVIAHRTTLSVEEFDTLTARPENRERLFELIAGMMVEVVSNGVSSQLGILLGGLIALWVRQNKLGYTTGADGGYIVNGERYIPDTAFISNQRQPRQSRAAYNPLAPDLAVEVLSPSNSPAEMRIKIVNYLLAGTVLWLADPDLQQIEVYTPGQPPKVIGIEGVLEGGEVLPGFTVALKDLFDQDTDEA
jgi:Uma2 family endonuclease